METPYQALGDDANIQRRRYVALAVAMGIQFGPHFVKQISSVKGFFTEDAEWNCLGNSCYGLSNEQWGTFQSAITLPNLLLPMVGGIMAQTAFGMKTSVVSFLLLVTIGQVMFYFSVLAHDYWWAVVSRIVIGTGEGAASSLSGAIASLFFSGENLAFAIGLTESFHALANFLSKASLAPVASAFGYSAAVFYGIVICCISLFMGVFWVWYQPSRSVFTDGHQEEPIARSSTDSVYCAFETKKLELTRENSLTVVGNKCRWGVLRLPLEFWLIGLLHLFFSNPHRVFGHIDAAFLSQKYNMTKTHAGLWSAMTESMGILTAPIMGKLIDILAKHGARGSHSTNSRKLMICQLGCCFAALLGAFSYFNLATNIFIGPRSALVCLAIANAITPTMLRTSVPQVVYGTQMAAAFGVFEAIESLGVFIGGWVVGTVQDTMGKSGYTPILHVFSCILITAAAICTYLVYRSLYHRSN